MFNGCRGEETGVFRAGESMLRTVVLKVAPRDFNVPVDVALNSVPRIRQPTYAKSMKFEVEKWRGVLLSDRAPWEGWLILFREVPGGSREL